MSSLSCIVKYSKSLKIKSTQKNIHSQYMKADHVDVIEDLDFKDNQKQTCVLVLTKTSLDVLHLSLVLYDSRSNQCSWVRWREREIIQTATKDMLTLNSADETDKSDNTTVSVAYNEPLQIQLRSLTLMWLWWHHGKHVHHL